MSVDPFNRIDSLLRSLITTGAILIAGVMITATKSWTSNAAIVALVLGLLSFVAAAQFLISIEMEKEVRPTNEKAKDSRLAIPFLFGYVCYLVAGVLICLRYIAERTGQ
jgi:hypothetical protein